MHKDCLSGVASWPRERRNRGVEGGIGSSAVGTRVDPPFARFVEERDSEK